jgi:hypothetical protein
MKPQACLRFAWVIFLIYILILSSYMFYANDFDFVFFDSIVNSLTNFT